MFHKSSFSSLRRAGLLIAFLAVLMAYPAVPANIRQGSNRLVIFSSEFYQQCAASKSGNVIVSPLSVGIALGMLSQGTNGNTLEEIKESLHAGNDKNEIADYFYDSHAKLFKNSGKSMFSVVNQIYLKEGLGIKKEFKDVAVSKFDSGIENLNFNEPATAASTINSFVAGKTNNKITELVSPDSVGPSTQLVLVNAVHFKGKWQVPFDKSKTYTDKFYKTESDTVDVEYMLAKKDMNFATLQDMDASVLEMKYADSSFSFICVLPNSRTGVSALETKLHSSSLPEIMGRMYEQEVDIKMPKFKATYDIEMTNILKKMGMDDMFSDSADLSGLLDSTLPLKVSEAIHKAFIEVTEEGTEAAAATAILIKLTSAPGMVKTTPKFYAEHPFIYYIWDRDTQSVIFHGRYSGYNAQ